jgi:hypothetical protein
MIADLIEALEVCGKGLDTVVTAGKDAPVSRILANCQHISEALGFAIGEMRAWASLYAPARREERRVRAGALIFDGLVYMHPALRRYNGIYVAVEWQGDRLIVSNGLDTICKLKVYDE